MVELLRKSQKRYRLLTVMSMPKELDTISEPNIDLARLSNLSSYPQSMDSTGFLMNADEPEELAAILNAIWFHVPSERFLETPVRNTTFGTTT